MLKGSCSACSSSASWLRWACAAVQSCCCRVPVRAHVFFLYFWQLQEVPSFVRAGTELCPAIGSGRERGWLFPSQACPCQMHAFSLRAQPQPTAPFPLALAQLPTCSAAGVKCSPATLHRSLRFFVLRGSGTSGSEVEPCVRGIAGSSSSCGGSGPR